MNWIQTYTGRAFEPLHPQADQIDIVDIAHALSMLCRFNGHCGRFYSVAEHSVWVSRRVAPQHAAWGLLHDAAEAYVSDVARPIKPHIAGFEEIENGILKAVAERFALGEEIPEEVLQADIRMLATERAQLMVTAPRDWSELEGFLPYDFVVACWTPEIAKHAFLSRYYEIFPESDATI